MQAARTSMMHFIAHSCPMATTKLVCVSFLAELLFTYFSCNAWGRKGGSGRSEVFKYIHVLLDQALLVLLKV